MRSATSRRVRRSTPLESESNRPREVRAKLFRNGGSQAVRLPRDCRFEGTSEVIIRREGRRVILEAPDEWSAEFLACLGSLDEDIPRLKQGRIKDLRSPFK